MSDSGSELRSREFGAAVAELGADQRFIHAGRTQTNGCVERVQGTILEECWKPSFARHLIPRQNGLRRDLVRYLDYYNTDAPTPAAGRAAVPLKASSARPGYGRDAQPDVSADPGGRTGEARNQAARTGRRSNWGRSFKSHCAAPALRAARNSAPSASTRTRSALVSCWRRPRPSFFGSLIVKR